MEPKYRYNKLAGALQEAGEADDSPRRQEPIQQQVINDPVDWRAPDLNIDESFSNIARAPIRGSFSAQGQSRSIHRSHENTADTRASFGGTQNNDGTGSSGRDPIHLQGNRSLWTYTVEEGQQALVTHKNGKIEIVVGPQKLWTYGKTIQPMAHFVAHPGEFLIVRFRDGRQEHLEGPANIWFDPRTHLAISKEESLQIATKEAVVVYSATSDGNVKRRVVQGPDVFTPKPGEWLHTFSWHGSKGGSQGYKKVPNSLVFQKLWLLPDQMYHDVTEVRTADDALLTIKLMIFFELIDIEKMLATTHDPIGDFVNAATSDVVDFLGKLDFESFKQNTDRLNELSAYKQLMSRAEQCGYSINKVVYRGYGAPTSLQQMHDQAIETRTRLQLERVTEQQAQELEDVKLEREIIRSTRQRTDRASEVEHEIAIAQSKREAEIADEKARNEARREHTRLEQQMALEQMRKANQEQQAHLEKLRALGVDLTALLTHSKADQVIELRGGEGAHVHVNTKRD